MVDLTGRYALEITAKDFERLESESVGIPTSIDVAITALPDEPLQPRLAAARRVKELGLVPIPHLAARRIGSIQELDWFVDSFKREAAVDQFFIIAGDVGHSSGPFMDALSIINSGILSKHGVKRIGIAGYPEGHPVISQDKLWQALISKGSALKGLNVPFEIVTQFSFDSDAVLAWLERLREAGVSAPVKIGIPGPASIKSLLRFASICGVNASSKVIAKYGFSLASLFRQAGPDALVKNLEDNYLSTSHGDISLHFYTFGGIGKTTDWVAAFRGRRSSSAAVGGTR